MRAKRKKTKPLEATTTITWLKTPFRNTVPTMVQYNTVPVCAPLMEETMNTTNNTPNTDLVLRARNSLTNALWSVSMNYDTAMTKKYGLKDEDLPKNAEDLIAKIKEGKFKAPDTTAEDYDEGDYRWSPYFGIKFRDPSMKKDREGYEKAMEAFREEKLAIELKVAVLEPAEALKFVEAFKTKHTIH